MEQRNGKPLFWENEVDFQDQIADLWDVVRRHKALVAVCWMIALGLGVLYYFQAPRTYESHADIVITTKRFGGFGAGGEQEQPVYEKTIETHALMVHSPLIIGRAMQDFNLIDLPSLADEEDPQQCIVDNLTVNLKEENTTVLAICYQSPRARDSRAVVSAIATTYEKFLKESHQQIGMETMALIRHAKDDLAEQLRMNQKEHRGFQCAAPIMWRDGRGINVHHERQTQIETARQGLLLEQTILKARIEAITVALADETSRDAVYYEALTELKPDANNSELLDFRLREEEALAEREAIREYASLLVGEYVRLMVTESELLDEFGEGHPRLNSLARRQQQVQELLEGILSNDMSVVDGVIVNRGTSGETNEEKDYVAIYMQLLSDRLAIIDLQLQRLDAAFGNEQELANAMQGYILQDQAFREDKERTTQLFDEVVERLKEIDLVRDYGGDTMDIIAPPQVGEQVWPNVIYVSVTASFLGGLLGCVLAWFVDRSEDTFRSASEIRQALHLPVVGRVPQVRHRGLKARPEYPRISPLVFTLHQENSPAAEAFRGVRTSLYFSMPAGEHKVIQVTSPLPGDGKSTVTANLGVAIAKSGKRVLVIDADFRRPKMDQMLGKPDGCRYGLAAVVAGQAEPLEAALATDIDNLFYLPAHERPVNPSELLSTPEFREFLQNVRQQFDFVLIDTPPLLAVTDPCAIAAQVDGVLLTLRLRRGVQAAATRATELLNGIEANILGVIVNGINEHDRGYGGYGYGLYTSEYHQPSNGSRGNQVAATLPRT